MKQILIVEDNPELREALEIAFTRAGYSIFKAADGEAGLRAAQKNNPDLILLDIVMPKMDGLTLMKELQRDLKTARIPIVFLTNLSDMETVAEVQSHGGHDFLVKSDWDIHDVVKLVAKKLGVKGGKNKTPARRRG